MLKVKNLKVSIEGKEILKGIDLEVGAGQLHILMGPNGSGKSTLAQVIMGDPSYKVESGELKMENHDFKNLSPDKRAKLGIFLGFQHPVEVPGVSVFNFLRKARNSRSMNYESGIKNKKNHNSRFMIPDSKTIAEFRQQLFEYASSLRLGEDFLRRSLNDGFSGGEKKRSEILQMIALAPKLAILDEIDSGLDVDGLKTVAEAIKKFALVNSHSSLVIITHYARILKYLKPDFVHVMIDGKIVKSGKMSMAKKIEEKGYNVWQTA